MKDLKQQLKDVYSVCFNDSKAYIDYAFDHKYNEENCLYEIIDGKIAAELFISYKKLVLSNEIFDCPYIWGVCTLPSMRRLGLAEKLMDRAHQKLKNQGYNICALHPFRHSFYEKFGYITYNKIFKVEGGKLSDKLEANLSIKKVEDIRAEDFKCVEKYKRTDINSYTFKTATINDIDIINDMYNSFMQSFNGYVYRDINDSKLIFEENNSDGKCTLIYQHNKIIGYFYNFNEDNEIVEFCCSDELVLLNERFKGYIINLPFSTELINLFNFQAVDFTMLKVLNQKELTQKILSKASFAENKKDKALELLNNFNHQEYVLAVTGAYEDFDLKLDKEAVEFFCKKNNYVFDKY